MSTDRIVALSRELVALEARRVAIIAEIHAATSPAPAHDPRQMVIPGAEPAASPPQRPEPSTGADSSSPARPNGKATHGATQSAILDALAANPSGLSVQDVATKCGISLIAARNTLSRLGKVGKAKSISRGVWGTVSPLDAAAAQDIE
jgi:hypothetical protein